MGKFGFIEKCRNIKLCGVVQQFREAAFLFSTYSVRLDFDVLHTRRL
jgi:hypothetical protein